MQQDHSGGRRTRQSTSGKQPGSHVHQGHSGGRRTRQSTSGKQPGSRVHQDHSGGHHTSEASSHRFPDLRNRQTARTLRATSAFPTTKKAVRPLFVSSTTGTKLTWNKSF
ncbi:hypothetical protein V5799_010791 [Amblyomma americanum]|uniref:Uncharacterized protein n=1 Tax=Amblyomma americanum TaxID=6943 RepID=A0AAQ4EIP4_AMBAM